MRVLAIAAFSVAVCVLLLAPSSTPFSESRAATKEPTSAAVTNAGCDVTGTAQSALAFKSSGDTVQDQEALISLAAAIQQMNAACNGIMMTGKTDAVLGVVDYPAGEYIIRAITRGSLTFAEKTLGGDSCQAGPRFNDFVISPGDATEGELYAFKIRQGCKIRYDIAGVSLPYTITIAPVLQNTRLILKPSTVK